LTTLQTNRFWGLFLHFFDFWALLKKIFFRNLFFQAY